MILERIFIYVGNLFLVLIARFSTTRNHALPSDMLLPKLNYIVIPLHG